MSGALEKNAVVLLATVTAVDLNTTNKTDLYTVPAGREAIIKEVTLTDMSAAQAAPADINLGDGTDCTSFTTGIDISSMDTQAEWWDFLLGSGLLTTDDIYDAGDVFGIKPDAAAGGALTVRADVYGIERDV